MSLDATQSQVRTTRMSLDLDTDELIVAVLDADGTVVSEVRVPAPPGEVESRQREANLTAATATLRTWADDAARVNVTTQNAQQVLQTIVERLGVFFDRFADLLEHEYGSPTETRTR